VPDRAGRERILGIQTTKMPLADDVDLKDIAERTDRFSGADLEDLVRRAGLIALRKSLEVDKVTMDDFEAALKESRASVTPEMETEYAQMSARLKQQASAIQPIGFITPGQLRSRTTPLE
jgi:transitional endoplasmic reticulum ATPase